MVTSGCNLALEQGFLINQSTQQTDSTMLAYFVEQDTTALPGEETQTVYSFQYDNQKRLRAFQRIEIGYDGYDSTWLRYAGNGTLPSGKVQSILEGGYYLTTDTSFSTYNTNGEIIKDSSVQYNYQYGVFFRITYTNQYVRSNNRITVSSTSRYHQSNSVLRDTTYFNVAYNNDNLILQSDSNQYAKQYQLTYDTHPNPLKIIGSKRNWFRSVKSAILDREMVQPNNCTNLLINYDAYQTPDQLDANFTYQYRADGYPLIKRITQTYTNPNYSFPANKFIYIYNR